MDKIRNHRERAINFLVPYLREFQNSQDLAGLNGDRWQYIEDCIWFVLFNLNIDNAQEYWLDLLGEKAGQPREVFQTDPDLFEFDNELKGLDNGLLVDVGGGGDTYVSLQDEIYRLVIKFAIVRNNFDGKRATMIEGIKTLTGAETVLIRDNPPLTMDLTIKAEIPSDLESTYSVLIRQIVPQCVELQNIYIEDINTSFKFDSETVGLDNGLLDDLLE